MAVIMPAVLVSCGSENEAPDTDYIEFTDSLGREVRVEKNPERAMTYAIEGMLPHNTLGATALKRLRVYKGSEHENAAQKPQVWTGEIK